MFRLLDDSAGALVFFVTKQLLSLKWGSRLPGFARQLSVQDDLAAWVKATPVGSAGLSAARLVGCADVFPAWVAFNGWSVSVNKWRK